MGGLAAGVVLCSVRFPDASITVVVSVDSQGLSALPGMHSQTIPAASAPGAAVAGGVVDV